MKKSARRQGQGYRHISEKPSDHRRRLCLSVCRPAREPGRTHASRPARQNALERESLELPYRICTRRVYLPVAAA
jgi:hypothetical protein